ncbi:MAG TPA: hypothetical protein VKQ72_08965 [Aggregatilineales bacterium]|nr:hypothetical protein [Aggregatilineales bacterium]
MSVPISDWATMKNQYFGDVNDYLKYAILRCFAEYGQLTIGLCWMLTGKDLRQDGNLTAYLKNGILWRDHDPVLFDFLYQTVAVENRREVSALAATSIIPGARYYGVPLQDTGTVRRDYFEAMFDCFAGVNVIFFDPDNGLEVRSVTPGKRNSSKYLYDAEVTSTFQRGYSPLIYQHFPRVQRAAFIHATMGRLSKATGSSDIYAFSTSRVAYFLVSQAGHAAQMKRCIEHIRSRLAQQIAVWTLEIC